MTDRKTLDGLRDISLELLRYNREDKAYRWGETLYEIFKYLEGRLEAVSNETPQPTPPNYNESENNQGVFENEQPEIPEGLKEVIDEKQGTVFVFTGCETVNIYTNEGGPSNE